MKFTSRSETATDLSQEKLRPKKNGVSGRLYVGEAMDGGPQRDEAASAAPLPPEDQEDGQPAQPLVRPDRPTPEMIAAHEVSHLPYRSWCRACVAGRGRAFQHKASTQYSTIPVVSMDYLYFNERADGSGLPTVVFRDRRSKAIFSHLLPCKGTTGSTHPERAILKDLNFLGYKKLVLKNDQEPAIKALAVAVRNGFNGEIAPEESPKGDGHGQSNGGAERSVQTVQGMVRTFKAGLEEKGITIEPTSAVLAWTWMVEYAGTLHTLFSQESNERMTPFQRIKGRSKLDARWQARVFLGEKIVGTNRGIFVVQSMRRQLDLGQSCPWAALEDLTGGNWGRCQATRTCGSTAGRY